MDESIPSAEASRPKAWLAFVLSLFVPGLGQLYSRRPLRALAALGFSLVVVIFVGPVVSSLLLGSLAGVISGWGMRVALFCIVPIDAAVIAVRTRTPPTRLNRWWVYAAFVVLVVWVAVVVPDVAAKRAPMRQFKIPSVSMKPTLLVGDHIVVRMAEGSSAHALGDLLIVEAPTEPFYLVVKRVAGLPGQRIELKRGHLWIDGQPTSSDGDPGVSQSSSQETLGDRRVAIRPCEASLCEFGPIVVPPDTVFVLGDNRGASLDSRQWGPLPVDRIRGSVLGIVWSTDRDTGLLRWRRMGARL
jgi:signal peptidase I